MAGALAEDVYIEFSNIQFIDNMLYFIAENDENLESDHFGKLELKYLVIRNVKDQVLFIDQGNQPVFEDMTDSEIRANKSQVRLIISIYKDNRARGRAVAISVHHKKISTLSCENKVISFKEIIPPDDIPDTKSEFIFFQRSVPGHNNKMLFESSLYEGYFLACQKEQGSFKLILKEKHEYGDTSIMFIVHGEQY
uniref:interleukin-18 n=1 Tax=Jaculus jaculus TaxID=51337 RepID=UPI001E1B23A9|nr:interleukin-18 [Jaculus jaculus]